MEVADFIVRIILISTFWLARNITSHENIHQYVNRYRHSDLCGYEHSPDTSNTIKTITRRSQFDCARSCSRTSRCTGYSYQPTDNTCILGKRTRGLNTCVGLVKTRGTVYFEEEEPGFCLNNGTYLTSRRRCKSCDKGWTGQRCETLARDCDDYCAAHVRVDGVYWDYIRPGGTADNLLKVRCMCYVFGLGCTTLSIRGFDDGNSFNQSWSAYKSGFKTNATSFWLGLENAYKIVTNGKKWSLVVQLHSKLNNSLRYQLLYRDFKLDSEARNYQISLKQTVKRSKNFTNWGDAFFNSNFTSINQMAFSTYDRDNDRAIDSNCALDYGGGWWFNNCTDANLNGFWTPADANLTLTQKTWMTLSENIAGAPAIGATVLYMCVHK